MRDDVLVREEVMKIIGRKIRRSRINEGERRAKRDARYLRIFNGSLQKDGIDKCSQTTSNAMSSDNDFMNRDLILKEVILQIKCDFLCFKKEDIFAFTSIHDIATNRTITCLGRISRMGGIAKRNASSSRKAR